MKAYAGRFWQGTALTKFFRLSGLIVFLSLFLYSIGASFLSLVPYPILSLFLGEGGFVSPGDPVYLIAETAPYVLAAAFVFWLASERLALSGAGVRLYFLNPILSLFNARWDRMKRIVIIERGTGPSSAVIDYWTRYRIPWRFAVHQRRYANGQELLDELRAMAEGRGVPVSTVRVSPTRLWVGCSAIIVGLGASAVSVGLVLLARISYDRQPDANLHWFPWPSMTVMAGLYFAFAIIVGFGFGALSVYHEGRPKPILLVMWLSALQGTSSLVVIWLVQIATYSVWAAQLMPVKASFQSPPVDPALQSALIPYAEMLAFILSGIAYYVACYWAIRGNRIRDVVGSRLTFSNVLGKLLGRKALVIGERQTSSLKTRNQGFTLHQELP